MREPNELEERFMDVYEDITELKDEVRLLRLSIECLDLKLKEAGDCLS